jgi:hypothetical protein
MRQWVLSVPSLLCFLFAISCAGRNQNKLAKSPILMNNRQQDCHS